MNDETQKNNNFDNIQKLYVEYNFFFMFKSNLQSKLSHTLFN